MNDLEKNGGTSVREGKTEEICLSATSFTTHLTRGHLGANPSLRGDEQKAIARVSRYKRLWTVIFRRDAYRTSCI